MIDKGVHWIDSLIHRWWNSALQKWKAVSAHLQSEQILPFGFARDNSDAHQSGKFTKAGGHQPIMQIAYI